MKISDIPSFFEKATQCWTICMYMYVYFYCHMQILDMHMLTCVPLYSLLFFKVFKIFLFLIILYCLKTSVYLTFNLFVCPWKR